MEPRHDLTNNSTLCLHHDCNQATSQAEGKHMNFLNGLKSHWVGLGPAALLNPPVHSPAYSLGQWFLTSSSLLKPPTPLALSLFSAKDVKPSLIDKIGKKKWTHPHRHIFQLPVCIPCLPPSDYEWNVPTAVKGQNLHLYPGAHSFQQLSPWLSRIITYSLFPGAFSPAANKL